VGRHGVILLATGNSSAHDVVIGSLVRRDEGEPQENSGSTECCLLYIPGQLKTPMLAMRVSLKGVTEPVTFRFEFKED
jgi:hypothetical protein